MAWSDGNPHYEALEAVRWDASWNWTSDWSISANAETVGESWNNEIEIVGNSLVQRAFWDSEDFYVGSDSFVDLGTFDEDGTDLECTALAGGGRTLPSCVALEHTADLGGPGYAYDTRIKMGGSQLAVDEFVGCFMGETDAAGAINTSSGAQVYYGVVGGATVDYLVICCHIAFALKFWEFPTYQGKIALPFKLAANTQYMMWTSMDYGSTISVILSDQYYHHSYGSVTVNGSLTSIGSGAYFLWPTSGHIGFGPATTFTGAKWNCHFYTHAHLVEDVWKYAYSPTLNMELTSGNDLFAEVTFAGAIGEARTDAEMDVYLEGKVNAPDPWTPFAWLPAYKGSTGIIMWQDLINPQVRLKENLADTYYGEGYKYLRVKVAFIVYHSPHKGPGISKIEIRRGDRRYFPLPVSEETISGGNLIEATVDRTFGLGSSQMGFAMADPDGVFSPWKATRWGEPNPLMYANDGTIYAPFLAHGNGVAMEYGWQKADGTILWIPAFYGYIQDIVASADSGVGQSVRVTCRDRLAELEMVAPIHLIVEPAKTRVEDEVLTEVGLAGYDAVLFASARTSWARDPAPVVMIDEEALPLEAYAVDYTNGQVRFKTSLGYSVRAKTREALIKNSTTLFTASRDDWSTEEAPEVFRLYFGAIGNDRFRLMTGMAIDPADYTVDEANGTVTLDNPTGTNQETALDGAVSATDRTLVVDSVAGIKYGSALIMAKDGLDITEAFASIYEGDGHWDWIHFNPNGQAFSDFEICRVIGINAGTRTLTLLWPLAYDHADDEPVFYCDYDASFNNPDTWYYGLAVSYWYYGDVTATYWYEVPGTNEVEDVIEAIMRHSGFALAELREPFDERLVPTGTGATELREFAGTRDNWDPEGDWTLKVNTVEVPEDTSLTATAFDPTARELTFAGDERGSIDTDKGLSGAMGTDRIFAVESVDYNAGDDETYVVIENVTSLIASWPETHVYPYQVDYKAGLVTFDSDYTADDDVTLECMYKTLQSTGITLSGGEIHYDQYETSMEAVQDILSKAAPNYKVTVDPDGVIRGEYVLQSKTTMRVRAYTAGQYTGWAKAVVIETADVEGETARQDTAATSGQRLYTRVVARGKSPTPPNLAVLGRCEFSDWDEMCADDAHNNSDTTWKAFKVFIEDNMVKEKRVKWLSDPTDDVDVGDYLNDGNYNTVLKFMWHDGDAPKVHGEVLVLTLPRHYRWDRIDLLGAITSWRCSVEVGWEAYPGAEISWALANNSQDRYDIGQGRWTSIKNDGPKSRVIKYVRVRVEEAWREDVTEDGWSVDTWTNYWIGLAQIYLWGSAEIEGTATLGGAIYVHRGAAVQVSVGIPNCPVRRLDYSEQPAGPTDDELEEIIVYRNHVDNTLTEGEEYSLDKQAGVITLFPGAVVHGDVIAARYRVGATQWFPTGGVTVMFAADGYIRDIEMLTRVGIRTKVMGADEGIVDHLDAVALAERVLEEFTRPTDTIDRLVVYRPDIRPGLTARIRDTHLGLDTNYLLESVRVSVTPSEVVTELSGTRYL